MLNDQFDSNNRDKTKTSFRLRVNRLRILIKKEMRKLSRFPQMTASGKTARVARRAGDAKNYESLATTNQSELSINLLKSLQLCDYFLFFILL